MLILINAYNQSITVYVSEVNFFYSERLESYKQLQGVTKTLRNIYKRYTFRNKYPKMLTLELLSVLLFFDCETFISLTELRSLQSGLTPPSCTPWAKAT